MSLADIKDVNLRLSEEINRNSTLKQIEIIIKSFYEKRFFEGIHSSKRLSYLYTKLKQNYNEENYLSAITYHKYRSAIARLRISAHFLPIKKGRHESTPREKRVFPLCFSRSIRDEQHYLMYCTSPGLMKLRIDYFNKIKELKLLIMNKLDCFLNIMASNTLLSNPVMGEFIFKILDEIEQNIYELR